METIQVKDKCFELYIPDGEIQRRVAEVAARIKADMAGERPLLVGILTGAYMFAADLSRALDGEYEMTFARYSSYAGMSSTGQLVEVMPIQVDIKDRIVILVEDVIDQQKYVNRLITLVDHIMGASAKGVLLYPDTMLPDGYTWDDLRYAWAKPSAIVPYHPRGGTDRPQQISTNATDIGAYEMVNLQMRLFEQISGVSGALQGQSAGATTGVALYESQIANSTVALSDIFESFESFLLQRDAKALTT